MPVREAPNEVVLDGNPRHEARAAMHVVNPEHASLGGVRQHDGFGLAGDDEHVPYRLVVIREHISVAPVHSFKIWIRYARARKVAKDVYTMSHLRQPLAHLPRHRLGAAHAVALERLGRPGLELMAEVKSNT